MKISLSKIKIFIFSILFFIPEGMSTIGETNFITNALFLNNKIIHYIIKLLYWTRNIVGISAIVIYILYRLYNVSYHRSKLKKVEASDILILFGIWVIFVSDRNTFIRINYIANYKFGFGNKISKWNNNRERLFVYPILFFWNKKSDYAYIIAYVYAFIFESEVH